MLLLIIRLDFWECDYSNWMKVWFLFHKNGTGFLHDFFCLRLFQHDSMGFWFKVNRLSDVKGSMQGAAQESANEPREQRERKR